MTSGWTAGHGGALGAIALVAILSFTTFSHAGSVLLGDAQGIAEISRFGVTLQSAAVTVPDAGNLQHDGSTATAPATLEWSFTSDDVVADLLVKATAKTFSSFTDTWGLVGGELTLDFVTDRPLHYRLSVANDTNDNSPLFGAIDGHEISAYGSGRDLEPLQFAEWSGILGAGKHTFSMRGSSDVHFIAVPRELAGQVRLEIGPAIAIPLPTAFWPGLGALALLAGASALRSRVAVE